MLRANEQPLKLTAGAKFVLHLVPHSYNSDGTRNVGEFANNMDTRKVFISYAHETESHNEKVFQLSERLRSEGIDCSIDQYEYRHLEAGPAGAAINLNKLISYLSSALKVTKGVMRDRNREAPEQGRSGKVQLLRKSSTIRR